MGSGRRSPSSAPCAPLANAAMSAGTRSPKASTVDSGRAAGLPDQVDDASHGRLRSARRQNDPEGVQDALLRRLHGGSGSAS